MHSLSSIPAEYILHNGELKHAANICVLFANEIFYITELAGLRAGAKGRGDQSGKISPRPVLPAGFRRGRLRYRRTVSSSEKVRLVS